VVIKLKLNLGCGQVKLKGYVNADIRKEHKPDVIVDITQKFPFKNEEFTEVLLDNVVEHLDFGIIDVLPEIKRILKTNGKLVIIAPNCFYWKNRIKFLYGHFSAENGYHFDHRWILKPSFLKSALEEYGFDCNQTSDLLDREIKIQARKRA
jgi:predicted SAM-dependent methyltransferase